MDASQQPEAVIRAEARARKAGQEGPLGFQHQLKTSQDGSFGPVLGSFLPGGLLPETGLLPSSLPKDPLEAVSQR